jgi:hypothetical protein
VLPALSAVQVDLHVHQSMRKLVIPVEVGPRNLRDFEIPMAKRDLQLGKHQVMGKAYRVQSLNARDENALQKRCNVIFLMSSAAIGWENMA